MSLRGMVLVILCSCSIISCTASRKIPPEWGEPVIAHGERHTGGCPNMGGRYLNQAEFAATNPDLLHGVPSRDEFNLAALFRFEGRQSEIETVRLTQLTENKLLVSFIDSYGRNVKTKEFGLNNYGKDISIRCYRDSIDIRYSVLTHANTGTSFFDHKTINLERSNDGSLIVTMSIYRSLVMLQTRKPSYVEYLLRFKSAKT